jgi:hypothetical protein
MMRDWRRSSTFRRELPTGGVPQPSESWQTCEKLGVVHDCFQKLAVDETGNANRGNQRPPWYDARLEAFLNLPKKVADWRRSSTFRKLADV